jgi:ribonuclease HI
MPWYGVKVGRTPGVFTNWKDVQKSITGFPGAKFKKFETEAEAREFAMIDAGDADAESVKIFNIYTDGSCIGNGSSKAIAGYGVYFGKDHPKNLSQRVPDEYPQTNNTGELWGLIRALEIAKDDFDLDSDSELFNVRVYSDSEYAIRCATTYGRRCEAQGWKKEIPNQGLVQHLLRAVDDLLELGIKVDFHHILAHTGKTDEHSLGNAEADRLANLAVGICEADADADADAEDDADDNDLRSYGIKVLERERKRESRQAIPHIRKEFIDVPFEKKDGAKLLGAKWDSRERSWYIPGDCDPDFSKALRKLFK